MIAVPYLFGIAWLCWWVLKRDGTWREAAALFFAPIIPVVAVASLYGQLPWVMFVAYAHMTALVFLPIYWVLRRYGRVGVGFPLLVGALSGVVSAMALNGWRIPGKEVVPFVALGLVSGVLFWAIAFLGSRPLRL
jgi:hypothetical protein